MDKENFGPAERIIQSILTYNDHMVHNRPGIVVADARFNIGVRWEPVTHKVEDGKKVVYRLTKVGNKSTKTKVGFLDETNQVKDDRGHVVGNYRPAGIFPEVAIWMYKQVAEVWKLDNEFAARWASHSFGEEHRDLKVVLAAFMLVQTRKGDPVREDGKVAFHDEDFRDVGEAMMLLHRKDGKDLNPKLLLRIHDLLTLPGIASINRELGFGKSARRPFLGRWEKAVEKWLRYREENPKLLAGLVKAGFGSTVRELSQRVGYKPDGTKFFEILRWKQAQAKDGRRQLAIGKEVAAAESWEGLTEMQICERISKDKPNFKRVVGLLQTGLTRAIVAAAIEAGSMSNKDLIIYTPTLEELGLLEVQDVRERWEKAVKESEDTRAANIATRVKNQGTKDKLQEAADTAVQKAVEEVMRDMEVYFMVDISGSMQGAIDRAKGTIAKFLQAFPPDKIHVSVFSTQGREIVIKHPSAAGVENAFRGILAGGGTDYGAGVRALQQYRPKEGSDVLFIFVGDESAQVFDSAVRQSGLNPMAFGLVKFVATENGNAVHLTAETLKIPCFQIDERTFADPYAIPRTLRALVAATPVGTTGRVAAAPRVSLAELILKTKMLEKPVWAS